MASVVNDRGEVVAEARTLEAAYRRARRADLADQATTVRNAAEGPQETFKWSWDVERYLGYGGRDGWRRIHDRSGPWRDYYHYKKRFGSIWYEILISKDYPTQTVFVVPITMRPFWSRSAEEQEKIGVEVKAHVSVVGLTMADLDRAVEAMAARYRALAGPRRRRSLEDVTYSRSGWIVDREEADKVLRGRDAVEGWKKDVEAIVLKEVRSSRGWPTGSLALNVIDNYGRVPDGIPRRALVKMVGSVLESMARRGLISKLTGGERVEWASGVEVRRIK